jgi:hypothetical protein
VPQRPKKVDKKAESAYTLLEVPVYLCFLSVFILYLYIYVSLSQALSKFYPKAIRSEKKASFFQDKAPEKLDISKIVSDANKAPRLAGAGAKATLRENDPDFVDNDDVPPLD